MANLFRYVVAFTAATSIIAAGSYGSAMLTHTPH
jgi:hypothetical protein